MDTLRTICVIILTICTTLQAYTQEIAEDKKSYTTGVRTITTNTFEFEYGNFCQIGLVSDPKIEGAVFIFAMMLYDKQGVAQVSKGDLLYLTFKNNTVLRIPYDGEPAKVGYKSLLTIGFSISENHIKEIIKENSLITEFRIESRDGYKIKRFEIPLGSGLKLDGVIRKLVNKLNGVN